jgi:Tfp pilus assembly protein PilZ
MTEIRQRRAHPRTNCTLPIIILTEDSRLLRSALMLNFSQGGLYFETASPIDKGELITVKVDENPDLKAAGCDNWRRCRAEVRWCAEIEIAGSRRYGCGVQYVA